MQDDSSPEAIADKYNIGLLAMLEVSLGTDPWLPRQGTVLTIPRQMLLPAPPSNGIVINLYPDDIGALFNSVPVCTRVQVIN